MSFSRKSVLACGALALLTGLPLHAQLLQPSANPTITVTQNVRQSKVIPAGINVDGASYLLKDNVLYDNEGFEQPTGAVYINCRTLVSNICTSDNPYAGWPQDFAFHWTFRPQVVGAGATGYVVSQAPANGRQGLVFNLSAAPGTSHIVLEGTFPSNAVSDVSNWYPGGNGTATLERWDVGDGSQSMLLDGTAGYESIVHYFDQSDSTDHSLMQLNGQYSFNFMARPETSFTVSVKVERLAPTGFVTLFQKTQTLTPGWGTYSLPFTASEVQQFGNGRVTVEVDGGSILLDDVSIARVESSNASPFRADALSTLKSLHPGTLRFMDGAGFAVTIDDAISRMGLRRPALSATTKLQAQTPSVDYFQALQLAQSVGARPWITLPQTISQAEIQNLIQWLSGSSSTPYGAKRAARGQTQPWTSVFPVIYLELGNESWNSITDSNNTGDPVTYGQHANDIFTAAHASGNWPSTGITLIADGWNTTTPDAATALFWESHVRSQITVPFMMSEAPYLYGTFNDGGSLEAIYGPLFGEVANFDDPVAGLETRLYADLAANGDDMGVYEENIGTVNGYAPQTAMDQMTSTVGSGIAVADHLLQMMGIGVKPQNLFTLTGVHNITQYGTRTNLWGAVLDIGGSTNIKRPTWLAEQMVNAAVLPTMLQTTQTGMVTYNQGASQNDYLPAINNVQNIRSYAFSDGVNTSLVVINMSRTGSTTVALAGVPVTTPTTVTQLTSANITDANETSQLVSPRVLTGKWTPTAFSLPPFSMTTFVWQPLTGTVGTATGLIQ